MTAPRSIAAPPGYRAIQREPGSPVYLVWAVRAAPQPDRLVGHVQRERHRGNLWTSWPVGGGLDVHHHQTGRAAVDHLCALDAGTHREVPG